MNLFERQVAVERSNWRDKEISNRHRDWGFNCPAVDLDFLMVEYNMGKPVGLVDYKHFHALVPPNEPAFKQFIKHASYRALSMLCDGYRDGPLPFIVARYWPTNWSFQVFPVNAYAMRHFKFSESLSEHEYVVRLYHLRRLVLNKELAGKLNTTKPPYIQEG